MHAYFLLVMLNKMNNSEINFKEKNIKSNGNISTTYYFTILGCAITD